MKTCKCAWCGAVVPLTKNGLRPKQHLNGRKVCPGSGQRVETHEMLRKANRGPV